MYMYITCSPMNMGVALSVTGNINDSIKACFLHVPVDVIHVVHAIVNNIKKGSSSPILMMLYSTPVLYSLIY